MGRGEPVGPTVSMDENGKQVAVGAIASENATASLVHKDSYVDFDSVIFRDEEPSGRPSSAENLFMAVMSGVEEGDQTRGGSLLPGAIVTESQNSISKMETIAPTIPVPTESQSGILNMPD